MADENENLENNNSGETESTERTEKVLKEAWAGKASTPGRTGISLVSTGTHADDPFPDVQASSGTSSESGQSQENKGGEAANADDGD